MNKLIAASVVAVICHATSAHAGVPGWCKEASFDTDYRLDGLTSQDSRTVIATLAKATCKPTAEASASSAQIETARQAWGKKLLMNDADWADAVDFANVGERPADLQFSVKDLTAMTPMDQYLAIYSRIPNTGSGFEDVDYLADMFEPNLTEVGRFAYISKCIDYEPVSFLPSVTYAQCQADIDAFDKAKFAVQLRSDTAHPGANKMGLRFRLYALPKALKKHAEDVQKILAKDAAYKKLWDAATKGRAQFASTIGADKELLALATKLDSANWFKSRKQFDGCEATTEAALAKVITSKVPASLFKDLVRDIPKPKDDFEAAKDITSFGSRAAPLLSDIPELVFVAGPYIECHPKSAVSSFLRGLYKFSVGYRGPRRAALGAISNEKIELDDMNAKIYYPPGNQPFETGSRVDTSGGVVKSVKEEDGLLLVALEKLMVKREECVKSHYTKKITRVNSDGSLSYELICDQWGTVTYDDTPADFRIDKMFQSLLKKGVQFSAQGGAVVAIWPNKTAKLPSHFLGAEVK